MKNFAVVMLAVASVFVLSSSAQAGGGTGAGGAKKNAKISVINNTADPIGVIIDLPNAQFNDAPTLVAAGGFLVQPGATVTVDVTAGVHRFRAFDVNLAPIADRNTPSIPKSKTLKATTLNGGIQFTY